MTNFLKLQGRNPCSFFIFGEMAKADLINYCPANVVSRPARKGRSESRIANRDEKLIYRFYYHAVIHNRNFASTVQQLSTEFDIEESVVTDRLKRKKDLMDMVFSRKPTIRQLRKQYPYYAW